MNNQLTIFSVTHKDFIFPECKFIRPIQVNKEKTGLELRFLSDNIGDNISNKNENYAELTALYWIWKNLNNINSEFVGLCHYRRYFTLPTKKNIFEKLTAWLHSNKKEIVLIKPAEQSYLNELGAQQVATQTINILKNNKVIVPTASSLKISKTINFSIKHHYIYFHVADDWNILEQVIKEKFPEYTQSLSFFDTHQHMHCYNMFISDKKFIENYCSWLFTILFEVEKRIYISKYPYQQRVLGFMAERLLNLYLYKNNIEKAEMPILYFE